jgi:rubrerythrin
MEVSMREPLLLCHPQVRAVTMRDLVGIANAIEQEAVSRYGQMAELMARRGEHETADAFRRMQREEQAHIDTVAGWAGEMNEAVPPPQEFEWQLPPEFVSSWDDIAGSALLTPYRAFAIAVRNEERAFSLYTYLAAHAEDARVEAEAEKLAAEELEHAALLRRWRRAAYHREHGGERRPRVDIGSLDEFLSLLAAREAEISGCHSELSRRLRRLGDSESADLLADLLGRPSREPDGVVACRDSDCGDDDPMRLLVAAQKPLERLSEDLENALESANEEISSAAEEALLNVVGRLARLRHQIELRMMSSRMGPGDDVDTANR